MLSVIRLPIHHFRWLLSRAFPILRPFVKLLDVGYFSDVFQRFIYERRLTRTLLIFFSNEKSFLIDSKFNLEHEVQHNHFLDTIQRVEFGLIRSLG